MAGDVSEYPELDRIVSGIRRGDEAAYSTLYRHTAGPLATFANSFLRDRRAAEDVVQQTFLELVRAAESISGDGRSLRAWLFRSARFNCLDELRRRRRRPEKPTAEIPETHQVAAVEGPTELDPELEAALRTLSERQRSLLVLRHVLGFSGDETAKVMKMTRAAAYAATARAQRRLERALSVESETDSAFLTTGEMEQLP